MGKIFAIGGGEIRNQTTIKLDEVIVNAAKEHAKGNRVNVLFIPTASHDSTPYYNSFHRVYTPLFNCKTEIAMSVYRPNTKENLEAKFAKADILYIGGGDTLFMIEHWKESGLLKMIKEAFNNGAIIAGLSAGAIYHFSDIYTDSSIEGSDTPYSMAHGLGDIKGVICPHYNEREEDFNKVVIDNNYQNAIAIENNAMIEIVDGNIVASYSSQNGNAYYLSNDNGKIKKEIITPCFKL